MPRELPGDTPREPAPREPALLLRDTPDERRFLLRAGGELMLDAGELGSLRDERGVVLERGVVPTARIGEPEKSWVIS